MNMNNRAAWALACGLFAGLAQAGGAPHSTRPVALQTPVAFAADSAVRDIVRQQCDLEKTLEADLFEALRAHGRPVDPVASAETGRVLQVSIERVEGLGGGAWTGPKFLSVKATLLVDGKFVHNRMALAHSTGFPLNTTCHALSKDSSDISQQIAKWLDDVDGADANSVPAPAPAPAASGAGS